MSCKPIVQCEAFDLLPDDGMPIRLRWELKIDDGIRLFTFESKATCVLYFIKGEQPEVELKDLIYTALEPIKNLIERDARMPIDDELVHNAYRKIYEFAKIESLL